MLKTKKGVVIGVGGGSKDRDMELHVGDNVVYKKANYPISDGCDIVHIEDVLYVE